MEEVLPVFLLTLLCAVLAVLLSAPPAWALAWALARKKFWGKAVIETLASMPLVLPPVATGLILLKLLGRRGALGAFLHESFGLDLAFSRAGVVVAMAVMAFPFIVRAARTAFEEVPSKLEDLARSLGLSEGKVFRRVTLPLAGRGLAAGLVQGLGRSLGEFGATITLAGMIPGQTETLAAAIYQRIQLGHDSEALIFVLMSLVVAFVSIWASEQWLGKRP